MNVYEENSENPTKKKMNFLEQYAYRLMDYTCNFTSKNASGPPAGNDFMIHWFGTYRNWWKMSEGAQKNYRPQDEEEIASDEFLLLEYEKAVVPESIKIYEKYNPGALVRIWGKATDGIWYLLYEANPEKCSENSRKLQPKLRQVNNLINIICLEFNHSQHHYYTYIDAVLLSGYVAENKRQLCDLSLLQYGESSKIKKPKILIVQEEENYFNGLPDEVMDRIFQYLDLKSISQCACVCKRWNDLSQGSSIYQNLNLKKYWVKINNKTLHYFECRCTYLKKLDLSWCGNKGAITENIFIDFMKKCCKHLTHLSVCNCDFIKDVAIEEISNCSQLIDLRLRNCKHASSESFSILSKLTKLETLDMYHTNISDDELVEIIKTNKNLKHLNLDYCSYMTMDLVAEILPIYNNKLITFSCFLVELTAEKVKHLSKCTQLKELYIGYCINYGEASDCLERIAQGCADLRRLTLSKWQGLNDDLLRPILKSCKHLTHLELLDVDNITADICEAALASLPKLTLLDVSFCKKVEKEKIDHLCNIYPRVTILRNG